MYRHTRTMGPAPTPACTGLGSTMMAASTWKVHAVRAEYAAHLLQTDHRPLRNAHRVMYPSAVCILAGLLQHSSPVSKDPVHAMHLDCPTFAKAVICVLLDHLVAFVVFVCSSQLVRSLFRHVVCADHG